MSFAKNWLTNTNTLKLMKEEEKEILLEEFCSRLPYGVKVLWNGNEGEQVVKIYNVKLYGNGFEDYIINGLQQPEPGYECSLRIDDNVKLYLRPISSMTEDERQEYMNLCYSLCDFIDNTDYLYPVYHITNWLNAHHFDYRGLIEKKLALEAPENLYEI